MVIVDTRVCYRVIKMIFSDAKESENKSGQLAKGAIICMNIEEYIREPSHPTPLPESVL